MRIGIVGTGWVGSSVASAMLQAGVAGELLVNDIDARLAEGEAMDRAHGGPFDASARVRAAGIDEMVYADAVVVSAGKGGGADDSRLELLRGNALLGPSKSKSGSRSGSTHHDTGRREAGRLRVIDRLRRVGL